MTTSDAALPNEKPTEDVSKVGATATIIPDAALREAIITMLRNYRLRANLAYSEVEDKFYTQAEYEKALTELENTLAESLQSYVQSAQQQLLADVKASLPEKLPDADKFELDAYKMAKHAEERSFNRAIDQVTAVLEGYQKQGKGGE